MATIYATKSESVSKYAVGTWSSIRDAATGVVYSFPTTDYNSSAIEAFHTPGRGSNVYRVARSFLLFDTSSITGTVSSADLSIYGYVRGTADVIAVKSDAYAGDGSSGIVAADFNNFDTSTPYSSEVTSWSTSGYNDISLNSTARTDIQNNNVLIVCVMEHDYDFQDSAPSSAAFTAGMYNVGYTGTSRDPHLEVTVSAGATVHTINTVAVANIATIKSVAHANIAEINTVTFD